MGALFLAACLRLVHRCCPMGKFGDVKKKVTHIFEGEGKETTDHEGGGRDGGDMQEKKGREACHDKLKRESNQNMLFCRVHRTYNCVHNLV